MLRLIRMAAVFGMLFALVDFCWTAIDAPQNYGLFQEKNCKEFKSHLHHALKDQYQSGLGFAVAAILYVLTRTRSCATCSQRPVPEGLVDSGDHDRAPQDDVT